MSLHRFFVALSCLIGLGISVQVRGEAPTPVPGIKNLKQVTPTILCGSQPESSESFEALARRGIKVIISVDGAQPLIEEAHKHGLRYVHVPIGYGKIGPQQRADLVEAVKTAGGPVFMHCHHGKHRGPAAAGYCGMATCDLTREQGLQLLAEAGTRKDYTGLWEAIQKFEPPQVPAGKLVEVAAVEPIVASMVRIDNHWSGLEKSLQAGEASSAEARQELLLLTEEFRELPRRHVTQDEDLEKQMQQAHEATESLLKAAESGAAAEIKMAASRLSQRCTDCHAAHR